MHGAERGRNAMETLVRLDYGYSDTIRINIFTNAPQHTS